MSRQPVYVMCEIRRGMIADEANVDDDGFATEVEGFVAEIWHRRLGLMHIATGTTAAAADRKAREEYARKSEAIVISNFIDGGAE